MVDVMNKWLTYSSDVDAMAKRGRSARPERSSDLWKTTLVVLAIGLIAQLTLFNATAASIVLAWWEKDAFNHGFFIIPISLFLMWRARHRLAQISPKPTVWGVGAMASAVFGWLLGKIAGVVFVEQLSFVLMLLALILSVVGWRVFRGALFPLLFLLFAVPFGEFLIPPLQDFTALFTVRALQLSGIPVFLEGLYIQIPAGTFEVAAACAGARFLITSVTLGALVANQFYQQTWRRVLFMTLAVVVPIIANGFRAYGLVMIAHLSGMELAVGADHLTFGLIFLSFVMVCLLAVGATFRERGEVDRSAHESVRAAAMSMKAPHKAALLGTALAAVLVAGSAAAYVPVIEKRGFEQARAIALSPPRVGSDWKPIADTQSGWRPTFYGAGDERLWFFGRGDQEVELYAAFYPYQGQDSEIVGWRNRVADGTVWQQFTTIDQTEVELEGKPHRVQRTHLRAAGKRRVVLFWYWIDGRFVADPRLAKLYQLKTQLLGGDQSAAVIAVATDDLETPEATMRLLREFLSQTSSFRAVFEAGRPANAAKQSNARQIPCPGDAPCAG
jgi:exosortase A